MELCLLVFEVRTMNQYDIQILQDTQTYSATLYSGKVSTLVLQYILNEVRTIYVGAAWRFNMEYEIENHCVYLLNKMEGCGFIEKNVRGIYEFRQFIKDFSPRDYYLHFATRDTKRIK